MVQVNLIVYSIFFATIIATTSRASAACTCNIYNGFGNGFVRGGNVYFATCPSGSDTCSGFYDCNAGATYNGFPNAKSCSFCCTCCCVTHGGKGGNCASLGSD